jgi:WhiB family redox-sensing transcriptional regulator
MKANNNKIYIQFQHKIQKLHDETGNLPECADNHDAFFPEDFQDPETRRYAVITAKAICNRCPLLVDCAEYAIEAKESDGIWGSQTAAERQLFIQSIKRYERRKKETTS